jgi:hypothetical protein
MCRRHFAICVLSALLSGPVLADMYLRCHIEQAGESRELDFHPHADPYGVRAIDIGSDFRFKAVVIGTQQRIDYVKTYAYFQTKRRLVLLHSARYSAPLATTPASLTGLNYVYSPGLERELRYECRLLGTAP